jgi:hypothetical protein
VRRVDQAEHAVLYEIAHVDRMRHRRRHAAGEGFDKRQAGNDSTGLTHGNGLRTHHKVSSGLPGVSFSTMPADARYRNGGTNCRGSVPVGAIRSLNCDLTDDLTRIYGRDPFQNCAKGGE